MSQERFEERVAKSRTAVEETVRRLLALARGKGASKQEVETATEKAQKLILEHNLDVAKFAKEEGISYSLDIIEKTVLMDTNLRNMSFKWLVTLGGGVAESVFCKMLYWDRSRTMRFYGTKSNVDFASDLYEFIRDQMKELANSEAIVERNRTGKHPLAFKPQFLIGCSYKVCERLVELQKEQAKQYAGAGALVLQSETRIKEYWKESKMKIKTVSQRTVQTKDFFTGYTKGDQVKLTFAKGELVS